MDSEGHIVDGEVINATWSWVSENLMLQSLDPCSYLHSYELLF